MWNLETELATWPSRPPERATALEAVHCALADNSQLMRRFRAQVETCRRYMQQSLNECSEPHCPDCNEVKALLEALRE